MGTTSPDNIVYPGTLDVPDAAPDMQALAESVQTAITSKNSTMSARVAILETALGAGDVVIKHGKQPYTANPSPAISEQVSQINFGYTYDTPPHVQLTCEVEGVGHHVTVALHSVTATGFKYNLKNYGGSTENSNVHWLAIGI